jgi:hypothetical protein
MLASLAFLEGCQHCHPHSVGNLLLGVAMLGHGGAFMTEATAADYDHLLATAMRWVDVR